MLEQLQKRWKVRGGQLVLILCTFAIGGSLTGYAGRKLLDPFHIRPEALWIVLYIILIAVLWPLAVLLVSIPFGQFPFFRKYIRRIGTRMGLGNRNLPTTRIAVFASGAGSNAQKIIDYFRNSPSVRIALIVCNNPHAGVLTIAEKEGIPVLLIEKEKFFRGNGYREELTEQKIDLVVLAGFLWKIPNNLLQAYPGHIINIHPALLPKYGGKAMYGTKVHQAVIAAGETESGITIHYVDEIYDHGETILQARCPVLPGDTPAALAEKVHALEHEHYPAAIDQLIKNGLSR